MQADTTLCLCLTPLHVLIAERIAARRGVPFDRGVYIVARSSDKARRYSERMRAFCDDVELQVVAEVDAGAHFKQLRIARARWRARRAFAAWADAGTVFAPSSVNDALFVALSTLRFTALETYDDGLLNVLPEPPPAFRHTRLTTRALMLLSGMRYWPERVRQRSARHHTIYDAPNAAARTESLTLREATPADAVGAPDDAPVVSLVIGPAPEADAEVRALLDAAARRHAAVGYLPHPRETRPLLEAVAPIATDLIAEEYVASLAAAQPQRRIDVFGYDSSALANLAQMARVTAYSLLPNTPRNAATCSLFAALGVRFDAVTAPVRRESP